MAEIKTYLELSEADGGSHKFYEVSVEEVRQAARGDFYRAYGTIKKLV